MEDVERIKVVVTALENARRPGRIFTCDMPHGVNRPQWEEAKEVLEALDRFDNQKQELIKEENKLICDQSAGQVGWTLPWAVTMLEDGTLWINGRYPFGDRKAGTRTLQIRIAENGVLINTSTMQNKPLLTHDTPWGNPALPIIGFY